MVSNPRANAGRLSSRPMASDAPQSGPVVLFTAFEPSGDALAAPVIAKLREKHPEWAIYAWGGDKMEAAGAQLARAHGR